MTTRYHTPRLIFPALAIAATLLICAPSDGFAASSADWSPKASEKLIKLPGNFLKKAVDNDFNLSPLASALIDIDDQISFKKDTLKDLNAASERADGDLKIELEHQTLAEKQQYIKLMSEHQDLRRKRAQTKVRLYEKLLRKLNRKQRAKTPQHARLLTNQSEARARMENSVTKIDTKIMRSSYTSESRYAREYANNLAAIESLVEAVNAHPMNQAPEVNGQALTQGEYLRQLIASNESEIAIVDQERAILGYMAKLVSLDALAVSEGLSGSETETAFNDEAEDPSHISSSVDLFITQ